MQMDYGASSLSQWALTEIFESGAYDEYLIKLRSKLKERRDIALAALNKYFSDIAEWIPVYAEIWGVFNIKRELSGAEYNRISASARQLEIQLRESHQQRSSLIPRLLKKYFWMADYLRPERIPKNCIRSLLKIKIIDQSIYESYIG